MTNEEFHPITSKDIVRVLGTTIKEDNDNKLTVFLCMLLAYTHGSQFGISFNAPSSTGKSFIATEVARLFPQMDVKEVGYASPSSFFHDHGEFSEEIGGYYVDFSHKILIFLDMPHNKLLERLRPILSHDKYEITIKITDRQEKKGLRTKNVVVRGFPVVIFATAGLKIDEQEATRFFLLSPQAHQEKIRQAIHSKIRKEADSVAYSAWLEELPERTELKQRIMAIKEAQINDVILPSPERIEQRFLSNHQTLKPRHQRDINRLLSLIKAFALLNLWHRERRDEWNIVATEQDIDEAFDLWSRISDSQDYNIPPYVYNLYRDIIIPLWQDRFTEFNGYVQGKGLSRTEISHRHHEVYGRTLNQQQLAYEILPMLETAGLIMLEANPNDNRQKLIYPITPSSIVSNANNISEANGVTEDNTKYHSLEELADSIPF